MLRGEELALFMDDLGCTVEMVDGGLLVSPRKPTLKQTKAGLDLRHRRVVAVLQRLAVKYRNPRVPRASFVSALQYAGILEGWEKPLKDAVRLGWLIPGSTNMMTLVGGEQEKKMKMKKKKKKTCQWVALPKGHYK